MLKDPKNFNNILILFEKARENARRSRVSITSEVWEAINTCWLYLNEELNKKINESKIQTIIKNIYNHRLLRLNVTLDWCSVQGSAHRTTPGQASHRPEARPQAKHQRRLTRGARPWRRLRGDEDVYCIHWGFPQRCCSPSPKSPLTTPKQLLNYPKITPESSRDIPKTSPKHPHWGGDTCILCMRILC